MVQLLKVEGYFFFFLYYKFRYYFIIFTLICYGVISSNEKGCLKYMNNSRSLVSNQNWLKHFKATFTLCMQTQRKTFFLCQNMLVRLYI